MSFRGVTLIGKGFVVSLQEAAHLGLGRREGLEQHIRPYRNGRDLLQRSRNAMVIDLFGLPEAEVRQRFPEVYQHLILNVKELRGDDQIPIGRDANRRDSYRNRWWVFGEPRGEQRPSLVGLSRYVVTTQTALHRVFQFLPAEVIPDQQLIVVAPKMLLSSAFSPHGTTYGGRSGRGALLKTAHAITTLPFSTLSLPPRSRPSSASPSPRLPKISIPPASLRSPKCRG